MTARELSKPRGRLVQDRVDLIRMDTHTDGLLDWISKGELRGGPHRIPVTDAATERDWVSAFGQIGSMIVQKPDVACVGQYTDCDGAGLRRAHLRVDCQSRDVAIEAPNYEDISRR